MAGAPGFRRLRAVLVGRRRRIAVHAPQRTVGVVRVVRGGVVLVDPVRLGVFDGRIAAQRADGRGQVACRPAGSAGPVHRVRVCRRGRCQLCAQATAHGGPARPRCCHRGYFTSSCAGLMRAPGLQACNGEIGTAAGQRDGGQTQRNQYGAGQYGTTEFCIHGRSPHGMGKTRPSWPHSRRREQAAHGDSPVDCPDAAVMTHYPRHEGQTQEGPALGRAFL